MSELETLYETVMERKANTEEGSYTSYLFAKGEQKILKKVGEECTEVVIASLAQNKEDLIAELGDLAYHVIVLMAQKGVAPDDVAAELRKRSEKKHNLKAERKPVTNY